MNAKLRKKISESVKESWARRKFDKETEKPNALVELAAENAAYRDALPDLALAHGNQLDTFGQIEQLALTWRGLEAQKWQVSGTPQLVPIIQGAIDRIRLEIILLCQEVIAQPKHVLD